MADDNTENENAEVETAETETGTKAEAGKKPGKAEKAEKPETSDGEAKLLKEVMKLKNALKQRDETLARFDGIDADSVKALLEEKAQREADLRAAEEKRLRDAGDFDALKKSMSEEHARQLKAERDARASEQAELASRLRVIEDLTVGQSFGNSSFLRDETLLTPTKARKLYGDYFDTENGVVKPYNKERGESGREPMVTASGDPLAFDEAMRRIIEADPDRERLMRSKARPGTGTQPSPGKAQQAQNAGPAPGVSRIAAALKAGK